MEARLHSPADVTASFVTPQPSGISILSLRDLIQNTCKTVYDHRYNADADGTNYPEDFFGDVYLEAFQVIRRDCEARRVVLSHGGREISFDDVHWGEALPGICILIEGGTVVGVKASPGLAHIVVSVCDVDNEAEAATQEYEAFSGVAVY